MFAARSTTAYLLLIFALVSPAAASAAARLPLTGVNLAGAEFGHPGGRLGVDYTYPSDADLDWVAAKGFSVIRIPFLWERLQPRLGAALDAAELAALAGAVRRAGQRNLNVILDPHNYARYRDKVIGTPSVPVSAFADFWSRLAEAFRSDPRVIFGLMNEPHDMKTEAWAEAAKAAIAAIRSARATNLILVPGNAYSGAHSWAAGGYGTPNAVAMRTITDPCENMAFEVHQYLDADYSGTSAVCLDPSRATDALAAVTSWLRETHNRGFLGEFGGSAEPRCLAGLTAMLRELDQNADVWLGWTYWAAGSWWPADYPLSVEPMNSLERPQMAILERWHGKQGATFAACHRHAQVKARSP